MQTSRLIVPEWLDSLPVDDPRAQASRRDLRRLNSIMGHRGCFRRTLLQHLAKTPPKRLAEIGAGDGTFLLALASQLRGQWPGVEVTLVDLHPVVTPKTLEAFRSIGWVAKVEVVDVFDWASRCDPFDVVMANLFLHHFPDNALRSLFQLLSSRAKLFMSCEPRRSNVGIAASRLLGLIGCNDVTRHDGPVSVRAGFRGTELSRLWVSSPEWWMEESRKGLFSHFFVASRKPRLENIPNGMAPASRFSGAGAGSK